MASSLAEHFSSKFGFNDLHTRNLVSDFANRAEGLAPPIDEIRIETALCKLKRQFKFDREGICVDLLRVAFESDSSKFMSFLHTIIASKGAMSSLSNPMLCFGKSSSVPSLDHVRGIVPLNCLSKLIDRVLSLALADELARILPTYVPGCLICGQKFTQAKDIGHGAVLLMEKATDRRSAGALAQGDIKQYFDSLPVLKICVWLEKKGVDVALLAAILRHQLFTIVCVIVHAACGKLEARSKGGLTGSNTALTLARVPVESSVYDVYQTCAVKGFDLGSHRLVFATYIDNAYAMAATPEDALDNLFALFKHLSDNWGLHLKDGSVSVLSAKGCDLSSLPSDDKAAVVEVATVLGWLINNSGTCSNQWNDALRKAWGIFHSNLRARGWSRLGIQRRLALPDRCVS